MGDFAESASQTIAQKLGLFICLIENTSSCIFVLASLLKLVNKAEVNNIPGNN